MSTLLSSETQVEDGCRTGLRTVRQTFAVPLPHGMHARPWAVVIKTLRRFRSSVEVEVNGKHASGQSIISLIMLGAGYGAKVAFTISGEDADQTLAAVRLLFQTHFEVVEKAVAAAATAPTVLCKR
ncbi:MAG TPA: HPr family phosphocarrier protein [Bacillota bacterium]|nr:HPr family phosphocarrier protein [Bacillota bacterium]